MSNELVLLAVLMFAATYPSRAIGLMSPALDRLPNVALDYLQLVGPAILAAIAAVGVMVATDDSGGTHFTIGVEWLAVLACIAITAWRRNLLFGLVAAVLLVAVARAAGVTPIVL